MTIDIREAVPSEIARAATTLSAAFDSYAWTRWSIPDDDYAFRLLRLQTIYLTHALEHGIVLVTGSCVGVAAMIPPQGPEPAESVKREIMTLMGSRWEEVVGAELPARLQDSWDFATLGVHPDHAGRGLGSALIREALSRVASSRYPRVSLETSALRNVTLYENHGFSVSHRTEIPGGPLVYTMSLEL